MDALCLFTAAFIGFLLAVNGDVPKEKDTQNFSVNDLLQLFGIDNHADVPEYEFIDLDKLIKHQRDNKKDSLCFKAFNEHFCVKFIPDKELAGQTHTIEFQDDNGTVSKFTNVLKRYTLGTVNSDSKSHAAFHDSGRGVTGHMKVDNQLFFFNYLPHDMKAPGRNHIIYKRKRRDTSFFDDVDSGIINKVIKGKQTVNSGRHTLTNQIEESLTKNDPVRSLPLYIKNKLHQKTMELMIAVDYKMVEIFAKGSNEDLTGYMAAIANIIYGFFQDPSLAYPLKVALVKTVIFKTNKFKAKNVYQLLDRFAAWCVRNNPKEDSDPEHWDNAILITGNGCEDGCGSEGLAVATMCTRRSVSVIKNRGLMNAITAVHEIGHNLHVDHDGSGKNTACPDSLNFMATGAASGPGEEEWSKCSSKALERALKSPQAKCYNDKPVDSSRIHFRLYGQEYNADRQCLFIYGRPMVKCIHNSYRCDRLYCSEKGGNLNSCKGISYPPIDGTRCGNNKWCIHGKCVPDGTTPPPPVNGAWSAWGDYTTCSKPCGVGAMWKERTCTNPKPLHGGRGCKGRTKKYFKACKREKCIGRNHPSRLEQCQKAHPKYTDAWLNPPKPCQLNCGYIGDNSLIVVKYVLEGTRCGPYHKADYATFRKNSPAICLNQRCQKMGCDLIVGSGAVLDRCGVCDGDGETCQLHKGKNTKKYNRRGHYPIVKIPKGAFEIHVKESHPTWLGFLGFKVGKRPYYAMSLPRASFGGYYKLGGTRIVYEMRGYNFADTITAKGKISEPISIFYFCFYGRHSPSKGIEWRYYGPVDKTTAVAPSFKWVAKRFSICNQWCAGGKKYREVICTRTDDNTQVKKASCNQSKKPSTVASCNEEPCGEKWLINKWTPCTKKCGKGSTNRTIECTRKTRLNLETVDEKFCETTEKPDIKLEKYCNVKMCPAKWHITTDFSECTKTCGGGFKYRKVYCKHVTEEAKLEVTSPVECIIHHKPLDIVKCNTDAC